MTIDLDASVTGVTGLKSVEFREGMSQATATVEVVCTAHSLSVGDSVDVTLMGESVMVGGFVRKIIERKPQFDYVISIQDILSRALDYFIVSDDPNDAYEAINIKAEDLVEVMLDMAGLTLTQKDVTIFTYGTADPVKINLVSSWSMIETINRVTGFITYADADGLIRFVERPPYVTASDTVSVHSFTTGSGDIIEIDYTRSTSGLCNRIVVYGASGSNIFYTAQAVSPYLPSGFYKSIVVAHPLIDSMATAIGTANVNLAIFNRLTETVTLRALGSAVRRAREIVDITESFTGLTSATKWLVFDVRHTLAEAGFESNYTLVR